MRKIFVLAGAFAVSAALILLPVSRQGSFEDWPPEAAAPRQIIEVPEILERIADCESGGRQFNAEGEVIRGIINPRDIGKWQINDFYWGDRARELGHDIHTLEGNTLMALYIYENYGTAPWGWSKHCWSRLSI